MDWERLGNDQVEEILTVTEHEFAEGRALQIEALEVLDRRPVFTAGGCRKPHRVGGVAVGHRVGHDKDPGADHAPHR